MTRKSAYYALAVVFSVVLAAGMVIGTSGVVLAENEGIGTGTMENSYSSEPESSMDQSETGEIREPVETGAVPDPDSSYSSLDRSHQLNGELPAVGVFGREYIPGVDGE
jgi:hypothetical protein